MILTLNRIFQPLLSQSAPGIWISQLFSHDGDVMSFSVSLDDEHGLIINPILLRCLP